MSKRRGELNEPALAHEREFNVKPETVVFVPQPTTLVGCFSEYIKGWSLICNTADGITLTLSRRDDAVVRVINTAKQDKKKFLTTSIRYRREDKWANAVKGVYLALEKEGVKAPGINLLLSGQGCVSGGDGFSSQIFVGLTVALNSLLSLGYTKDRIFETAVEASSVSSFPESARRRDIWVLTYGEKDHVYLFDGKTGSVKTAGYSISPETSCIFDSSLPYSVLTPEYIEFRQNLPSLVETVTKKLPKGTELRNLGEKDVRFYSSGLIDYEKRCLVFLILSSEYAKKAFECIEKGEGTALGRTLSLAQRSMVMNAELTCPELDWIFRRSRESKSVIGMASISIGTAGSFLCIVDEKSTFPDNQKVEEYERIFGFHPKKLAFIPYSSAEVIG